MQQLRRLAARRSARWESGRFVAEGPKLLAEALAAGVLPDAVFVERAGITAQAAALIDQASAAGVAVREVERGVLARAGDSVTPQAVASVLPMCHVPLSALPGEGLVLCCAGLADPGNAGTILRSAAASGAAGVVFCAGGVDPYNPKAVRASAGALFQVPFAALPEPAPALAALRAGGRACWASVPAGGRHHDAIDWGRPAVVAIGSESHGLAADLGAVMDGEVTVPMARRTESLNAAMAATVICFEAARQRRTRAGSTS